MSRINHVVSFDRFARLVDSALREYSDTRLASYPETALVEDYFESRMSVGEAARRAVGCAKAILAEEYRCFYDSALLDAMEVA